MSNKSKNVGTVAKAKIYLQSVDPFSIFAMRLAQCTFYSLHFAAVYLVEVYCRSVAVCLEQCYGIRIYRLCGVVELSLLSETTVDKDFLCSKLVDYLLKLLVNCLCSFTVLCPEIIICITHITRRSSLRGIHALILTSIHLILTSIHL